MKDEKLTRRAALNARHDGLEGDPGEPVEIPAHLRSTGKSIAMQIQEQIAIQISKKHPAP